MLFGNSRITNISQRVHYSSGTVPSTLICKKIVFPPSIKRINIQDIVGEISNSAIFPGKVCYNGKLKIKELTQDGTLHFEFNDVYREDYKIIRGVLIAQGIEVKLLDEALEFAEQKHEGQFRKDGFPYINHPVRVALILLKDFGCYDITALCAALLHDVIEDTNISKDVIQEKFGSDVANIVETLSKTGQSEEQYYSDILNHTDERVRLVKLADRWHNICGIKSIRKDDRLAIKYFYQVKKWFIPMAEIVNPLIAKRFTDWFNNIAEASSFLKY